MTLGEMTMPANFRYQEVFSLGRPRHRQGDSFAQKHPAMDRGKRAKIFSPFDALRGFSDAVAAKDVQYENRPELTEEEQMEISRRLSILLDLTKNSRLARENRPEIRVNCFVPCADPDHFAFGYRGQCRTVSGFCKKVDEVFRTLTVGDTAVRFEDILSLEAEGIFEEDWGLESP